MLGFLGINRNWDDLRRSTEAYCRMYLSCRVLIDRIDNNLSSSLLQGKKTDTMALLVRAGFFWEILIYSNLSALKGFLRHMYKYFEPDEGDKNGKDLATKRKRSVDEDEDLSTRNRS